MAQTELNLLRGTQVIARGLRWEVVDAQPLGQQRLYRLRGLEAAVRGEEIDLLSPLESIEPVRTELDPTRASPLRNWLVYHQAFLLEQRLGPTEFVAVQPGRLRLEPYQLVPVLRALEMPRVRLLLADGVGLGKTIQAGLVVCELMARRLAHRLLVVSPAGPLLEQWRTEFRERFGIRLTHIDRQQLDEVRRSQELGANPFDHIPLGLASIDFLKQEKILTLIERSTYDVVIIDEAHHCSDIGSAAEYEDSQRRRLAQVLSRRCDSLILATATPHDGNDRSFASLCELLDPSLVDGRGVLRDNRYRRHVVRRLKKHVRDPQTGEQLLKDRVVTPCPISFTPESHPHFAAMQKALLQLVAPELRSAFRARRYSDALAFMALLKRSVSTAAACRNTLAVVRDRFKTLLEGRQEGEAGRKERLRTLRELRRRMERFGTLTYEEEAARERLEAEDLAHQLAAAEREARRDTRLRRKTGSLVDGLDSLLKLADAAVEDDPKLAGLLEQIRSIRAGEPKANILVYTEYTDSQAAAVQRLSEAGVGEILMLRGEDPDDRRIAITGQFRDRDNLILVSTDACAEGLNLHQRCHHLIHLELPFNPNRLEQRNGRIDRFGQRDTPMVRYLFLKGTFEERVLLRLIAKYERQRARLTFVPNTLGLVSTTDAAAERLIKPLLEEDAKLFKTETPELFELTDPEAERSDDPATRELLEEIDRSMGGYERAAVANAWLGDAGLNAESSHLASADQARKAGMSRTLIDLAAFVRDAVLLDNGDVKDDDGETFALRLPPLWRTGLDDLPGYDPESSLIRLTTNPETTQDRHGRTVAYLGRAHPLVRRALDRVRNASFGSPGTSQDIRVSAVEGDVDSPELLCTFLARVPSDGGRPLEEVLVARVQKGRAPVILGSPADWMAFARLDRAINASKVWERHFESWGEPALREAGKCCLEHFRPKGESFIKSEKARLESDRQSLDRWIAIRSREITKDEQPEIPQPTLFDEGGGRPPEIPAWANLDDGIERLAAFYADRARPASKRNEADGAIRIYRQRLQAIERQGRMGEPEVVPIGLLMILPSGGPDGA